MHVCITPSCPYPIGWLNAYAEGGWLPSWASPGYRNCMVGTYADVVIADAIIKGIPGFDYGMAQAALHKDAFQEPPGYAGMGACVCVCVCLLW